MSQTVTLDLPDDAADRYRRGASAARKPLEQFLVERLTESAPPPTDDLAPGLGDELRRMESLDDDALWTITRASLSPAQQRRYDRLLDKNGRSALTHREQQTLHAIGEEARLLTLKKAHACLILKWRGHELPLQSLVDHAH
jgi:hypothetical protein